MTLPFGLLDLQIHRLAVTALPLQVPRFRLVSSSGEAWSRAFGASRCSGLGR